MLHTFLFYDSIIIILEIKSFCSFKTTQHSNNIYIYTCHILYVENEVQVIDFAKITQCRSVIVKSYLIPRWTWQLKERHAYKFAFSGVELSTCNNFNFLPLKCHFQVLPTFHLLVYCRVGDSIVTKWYF